jgi:hypothetical protein
MKMSRSISLEELGEHLSIAKEQLSLEKKEILKSCRLPRAANREEYAFAYLRAERIGMQAINARLAEIAWLPMQLDPQSELVAENRDALKRWVTAPGGSDPGAEDFGNDFIHALARSALSHGWDDPATKKLASRISSLFRDLSCLIGMIYFTTWLADRDVEGIALSDPEDLHRSVVETAAIVQSPELQRALRLRAEDMKKAKAKKSLEKTAEKSRPFLRLIRNENYVDQGFMPDPLPV